MLDGEVGEGREGRSKEEERRRKEEEEIGEGPFERVFLFWVWVSGAVLGVFVLGTVGLDGPTFG